MESFSVIALLAVTFVSTTVTGQQQGSFVIRTIALPPNSSVDLTVPNTAFVANSSSPNVTVTVTDNGGGRTSVAPSLPVAPVVAAATAMLSNVTVAVLGNVTDRDRMVFTSGNGSDRVAPNNRTMSGRSLPDFPTAKCTPQSNAVLTPDWKTCAYSNCGTFLKLDCTAINASDLASALQSMNTSQVSARTTLPLALRLTNSTVNITRALFAYVANQLIKIELSQVNIPVLADDAFTDLSILAILKMDGVSLDKIQAGVFKGLEDTMQLISLKNLPTLAVVQKEAFDNFLTSKSLRCLEIDVNSPKFTCDCVNGISAATQRTLTALGNLASANSLNKTMWQDMYLDGSVMVQTKCNVDLFCSNSSTVAEVRTKDIMDVKFDVACPAPVTETTTVATTKAPPPPPTTLKTLSSGASVLTSFSTISVVLVALFSIV